MAILRLLAGGYSNKEIARAMFLAEGTVKNYVSVILETLGTIAPARCSRRSPCG